MWSKSLRRPFPPCRCRRRSLALDAIQGTALLLLRTPTAPDGPYQRAVFAGRQRVIELQVQGRFTARPDGPLFFGAEIAERMRLGLLTRTFSKVQHDRVARARAGVHSRCSVQKPGLTCRSTLCSDVDKALGGHIYLP